MSVSCAAFVVITLDWWQPDRGRAPGWECCSSNLIFLGRRSAPENTFEYVVKRRMDFGPDT
jgi:hypothetical protein